MVKNFLKKNNDYVIFSGLITGLAVTLQIIPMDLLGEYTQYVVAGLILLAGYCFYEHHFNKQKQIPSYEKYQQSRDLSNPSYRRDLERQMRR